MAGARAEVTNLDTGAVFRTQTTEAGYYPRPACPGQLCGFGRDAGLQETVRSGLRLQVNQNAEINLRLEIGQLAETVEVVAQTPWWIPAAPRWGR